jgi:hypothetical protein
MAEGRQLDFWGALRISAIPEVRILRQGRRTVIEQTGEIRLEGRPKDAARILGLPIKTVYRMMEAGEIPYSCPRRNFPGNETRVDALGRRLGFSAVVDLKAVFRLKFGQVGEDALRDLGLN